MVQSIDDSRTMDNEMVNKSLSTEQLKQSEGGVTSAWLWLQSLVQKNVCVSTHTASSLMCMTDDIPQN